VTTIIDPAGNLVLALAVILAAAKLGGHLCERLGQPPVLGELLAGVLLGNSGLATDWVHGVTSDTAINGLAQVGVVVLLFEIGLESTLADMRKVGARAFRVALLGVLTPWLLGYGVGALLMPERSHYAHLFLGAVLTATSVGITARVLRDLGRSQTPEARIILGAAVVDDVMGLVILAVVGGLIQAADLGTSLSTGAVLWILAKAVLFLAGALWIGQMLAPRLFSSSARLKGGSVLLVTALVFCFLISAGAAGVGLAPIVGAYAAGLVLERAHYQDFTDRGERPLEELIKPISAFLVPVFFVLMGLKVDLHGLADPRQLGLALAVIAAAIIGKQACSLAGLGSTVDRLTIGIGMIPRGEVGLIFANIGLGLTIAGQPIVDRALYSIIVLMVLVTTVVTPPALKWSLGRVGRH
jgi:Kef-type K+ transport system membrane component KefB